MLKVAGLLGSWKSKASQKSTGFEQPLHPHEHWHIDVSHINIAGTLPARCRASRSLRSACGWRSPYGRLYYLCSILDGCSRFIVHFELRESMTEADVETILQRAIEKFPTHKPSLISDNGPQFIAKDFREFVRIAGLTHVKTSPYYPQSNGKIERWHKSLKNDGIHPGTPLDIEQARRLIARYVDDNNTERLHSAHGFITPQDKLHGKEKAIFAARNQKLASARLQRKINRQYQPAHSVTPESRFSN